MNSLIIQRDSPLILIVDDDKFMRIQLRHAMQQAGYQVVEASDGEEALAAYSHIQPDMVLLDALMPVMDGFTCCEQLRNLPGGDRTPVLMITALDDQESVDRAFEVGALDYITKPIHWAVLCQRVCRILQGSRATQELQQQTERAQLSEERLKLALEAAQMVSWDWDILNNEVIYSATTPAIWGLTPSTLNSTDESFLTNVHPEDQELVTQALHRAVKDGVDYDIEFRVIWPNDNTIHWIESKGRVYYDKTGKAVRMLGINMDVTVRKQAEEEHIQLLERERIARAESEAARAAAEEARQKSTNILESITDAFFALDNEWRFTYLNQQAEHLLQRTRQELLGKNLWDEFPEAVHLAFFEQYHHALSQQVSVEFKEFYPPLNAWLEVHAYPSLDGLSVYFQDITERQRAEDALLESQARFRRLVESNIIGIIFADLSGQIAMANNAFLQMVGYTREEVDSGQLRWDEMTPPEYHHLDEQALKEFRESGVCNSLEKEFIHKDGRRIPVVLGGALLEGSQECAICFVLDITERKQAQEELQRQTMRSQLFSEVTLKIRRSLQIEQILQTTVTEVQRIFQTDRVLIFQLGSNGFGKVVTEAVSPNWLSVLGEKIIEDYFETEYLQKYSQGRIYTIVDIEKAEVPPCLIEFLQQFSVKAKLAVPIFLKEKLWGLLIAHQCDRPRQWSSFETELMGQLAAQIGIALAQAQLLEQETRQRQELARSNRELQQFASIASHDLQEPLRKIQTFSNRVKEKYGEVLADQGRDYLERMENAARRMQTLIDDLLTLSRVTTKAQPFVPVNLAQVTQEVLSDLEVCIQNNEGHVEVGELPTIDADPVQMRQLLQNLISNAMKFRRQEEPQVVKIYSQQPEGQQNHSTGSSTVDFYQIIVEDNGIGFDEQYLDRIFNVFQRLHSRREYEGTGMGLAICRKIAERHGGNITAESTLGKGAKFIVTLPRQQRTGENAE